MNKLLEYQLEKYLDNPPQLAGNFMELLNAISISYDKYERGEKIDSKSTGLNEEDICANAFAVQAEKELKWSLLMLEATIESTVDGILVSDFNGKIIRFNNKFIDLWSIPKEIADTKDEEKVIAFVLGLLVAPGEFLSSIKELSASQKNISSDMLKLKDGRTIERYSQLLVIEDVCVGRTWSFRDITERTQVEEKLIQSERYSRNLFDQSTVGLALSDIDGTLRDINEAYAKITGRTIEECKKISFYDITPEKYNAQERKQLDDLESTGKYGPYEKEDSHKDGHLVPVRLSGTLLERNGKKYVWSSVEDITQRKQTETRLIKSEERYRQIVETSQEGIWMIDEKNDTTFVNKKMCEIIEYPPEEIMGKKIHFFMDEIANKSAASQIERRKKGISENHDSTFITKKGRAVPTSVSTNPIFDEAGNYKGALAMITDITKRKLHEELIKKSEANLDRKNKELKRKNTELEQFAYVASHDLQEPLRTTSGFVQLLKQQYHGKLDKRADQYLDFIADSSDRMRILINDLLDYSRIGGKNELENVDCNKIMQYVIADLYNAISESGAAIITGGLPVIMGYPTEIKQLFQNLVINAIKFSKKNEAPQINISAEKIGRHWDFSITDNGIGIDKIYSERIFIIFQRLHNRSEYPGSGIGLSHCKKIVELHHGKIWVESTPGEGSAFHFTIPETDSI
ncbi:MAG: PAS domain S-box protein [Ferruginibacter sp.]